MDKNGKDRKQKGMRWRQERKVKKRAGLHFIINSFCQPVELENETCFTSCSLEKTRTAPAAVCTRCKKHKINMLTTLLRIKGCLKHISERELARRGKANTNY